MAPRRRPRRGGEASGGRCQERRLRPDGDAAAHHLKQDLDAALVVDRLELADELGERPGEEPHLVARPQALVDLQHPVGRSQGVFGPITAELIETAVACASVGNFAAFQVEVAAWRSTAEICSDPELFAILNAPLKIDHGGTVPRPELP